MSQRIYLLAVDGETSRAVLEAANEIPLLWLALIDAATPDSAFAPGATLRLGNGRNLGLLLRRDDAIARLRARQPGLVAWLGDAAGGVVDQFAGFLGLQIGTTLRLDLSEWADAVDSTTEAVQALLADVAALDTRPGKRRPPAVKQLLARSGLDTVSPDEPAFGSLLGGVACAGREPWRRDPPRERRIPGERVYWCGQPERHFVSADGKVVATTVTSFANVETPVIWTPRPGERPRTTAIPERIGYVYPEALSADGCALFCSAVCHPGAVSTTIRCSADGIRVLHEGEPGFSVSACSGDGTVAGGALYPPYPGKPLAAWWNASDGVRTLPSALPGSVVRRVSGNGRVLAGDRPHATSDGPWQGLQAWTWRPGEPRPTPVVEGWGLQWDALSADGRSGVLAVQPGQHDGPRRLLWRDDGELVPVEIEGSELREIVFSPDLRCALALIDGRLVIWNADGRIETTLPPTSEPVVPCHVGNGGDWWAATVRDPADDRTQAVLLQERGAQPRRFDLPTSGDAAGVQLLVASFCSEPGDLVLFGQWRDTLEPVTWSPVHGLSSWGDAPIMSG